MRLKFFMNFNICHRYKKGFTLMEMLISMVVISILMAASVPLITQFSSSKTGVDKNTVDCIKSNISTGWYDTDGAGATTTPTSNSSCYAAVVDAQFNRGRALSTDFWYTEHGTTDQKSMAKKILRAACDLGGDKACDYFVNKCMTDGSASTPYCNDTSAYTDITYYMNLDKATYHNSGANYLLRMLEETLPKMNPNLLNEVFADCAADSSSIACDLAKNSIYIQGCNRGNAQACQYAYDNNLNKSCYQIKQAWEDASTGTYKLTYNGVENPVSVACNMYSVASAAITGCNASPYVSLDCTYGWNNSYNRTCDQISAIWQYAPSGTYNLTSNGAPPTAPVSATCIGLNPDCTNQVGSVCLDGTRYAGTYGGKYYFTPLTDANNSNIIAWNNGNLGVLNGTTTTDGQGNTTLLVNATDEGAPYPAANFCNNFSYGGHDDWYLPAVSDMTTWQLNYVSGFTDLYPTTTSYYEIMTSSESSPIWIYIYRLGVNYPGAYTGPDQSNYHKLSTFRTKCFRADTTQDASCPTPGNTCSDGTRYAGLNGANYLYITPVTSDAYTTFATRLAGGVTTGATSSTNGWYNTQLLLSKGDNGDTGAPYLAARACNQYNLDNYKGHTDWYLPAISELAMMMPNLSLLGMTSGWYYWSSTESSSYSAGFRVGTSGYSYDLKYKLERVRCVRKQDAVATSCTSTPGTMCPDGTYYVGYYNNRYIFAEPADEAGTYNWGPNGVMGSTDTMNGNNNMNTITALGITSYPAFQACKSLNDTNFKGHTDWYLPANGELNMLYSQKNAIGLLPNVFYQSSVEGDETHNYTLRMSDGYVVSGLARYSNEYVRCVRDE